MFKKLLIFFMFIFIPVSYCQVSIEWIRTLGSVMGNHDGAISMVIDNNQYIYVGAVLNSHSDDTVAIMKYDLSGNKLWQVNYGDSVHYIDALRKICLDKFGNIYVLGSRNSFNIYILKISNTGNIIWSRTLNGQIFDLSEPLTTDNLGNVLIAYKTAFTNTGLDFTTSKLNSNGDVLWSNIFDGPVHRDDYPEHVKTDSFNNVYVTGAAGVGVSSTNQTIYNTATFKYNQGGTEVWRNLSSLGSSGYSLDLIDSNLFVINISTLLKYSTNGYLSWHREFYEVGTNKILIDHQNNIVISSFVSFPVTRFVTKKIAPDGNWIWTNISSPEGSTQDYNMRMRIDKLNNVYLTGYSYKSNYNTDITTLKINSNGITSWIASYNNNLNGHSFDNGSDLVLDSLHNVYVCGSSYNSNLDADIIIIKYSQVIGIKNYNIENSSVFSLSQNYPNPFNPVTKIKFNIPQRETTQRVISTRLIVYDAMGQEVAVLVNQQLQPGTYEADWDASAYPSGVYYYRFESDSFSETKKMVLIK